MFAGSNHPAPERLLAWPFLEGKGLKRGWCEMEIEYIDPILRPEYVAGP